MLEAIAQQNPTFRFVEGSTWYAPYLCANGNRVKVTITEHRSARTHQRYSVKSTYKEYGSSYSCGNRRAETSYRTKNTSKRFASLEDAVKFALSEIA